ncbi:MAG: hypothetical protein WAM39_24335 [Bryobacteraceae bacterium]
MRSAAWPAGDAAQHLFNLRRVSDCWFRDDEWVCSRDDTPLALDNVTLGDVWPVTVQRFRPDIAQREITTALESALDARRQRITISRSQVNSGRCDRAYWLNHDPTGMVEAGFGPATK